MVNNVKRFFKKNITLDLTKPLSSGAIHVDSFLQTQAKIKLDELLKSFSNQKVVGEDSSIFDSPRYNNTIFVSGQRGAGKTTFLKTYLSELNIESQNGGDIYPVTLIDPTLVHTNQPILVEIITCLKRTFEKEINGCQKSEKYHEFRAQLGELSEGLKLLKIKKEDVDQDASWFLNKAIKNADSGHSLERNLNKLIDILLESINKKLLVIAIDDVDNDTTKAHDVLETIRKYLTHPNIVIVVSGDLKIYSHIVKIKKLEELSSQLLKIDNKTSDLVEHLEQQYLVKVFPAEQRIHLKTLQGIISEDDSISIVLKTTHSGNSTEITNALDTLLVNNFNIDKSFINTYRSFIFEQPIRTILQLFKNVDYKNYSSDNATDFSEFIRSSYIGFLQKEGINSDKLLSTLLHQNDIGLADFNINSRYGELETGYYSRTDGEQDSYNSSQIFLASVKSNFLNSSDNHIGAAIQLMLSTAATSNIYLNYVEEKIKEKANKQDYIDFIGINRYSPTTSLVPHFSPFILDFKGANRPVVMGGVARLPRSSKPGDNFIQCLKNHFNLEDIDSNFRIKTLNDLIKKQDEKNTSFVEFLSAKSITMSSHSSLTKNEGRDYLSSYLLLSVIGELLSAGDNEINLDILISKFGSIQTFSSPSFVNIEAQGSGETLDMGVEEQNVDITGEDIVNNNRLNELLVNWVGKNKSKENKVSFLLVGKVWSRIHYTLNSISEIANTRKVVDSEGNTRYIFLGELMTRWVTGIINSSLIEEARYKPKFDGLLVSSLSKAKNVASASNVFIQNLNIVFSHYENNIVKIKEELPFTTCLLLCPLLWPFFLSEITKVEIRSTLEEIIKNDFDKIDFLDELFLERHKGLEFVSRLPIIGWNK